MSRGVGGGGGGRRDGAVSSTAAAVDGDSDDRDSDRRPGTSTSTDTAAGAGSSRSAADGATSHGGGGGGGGLPLMIVCNKIDKLSATHLASLQSTCSNHIFVTAASENMPFDPRAFEIFFNELYLRKAQLNLQSKS